MWWKATSISIFIVMVLLVIGACGGGQEDASIELSDRDRDLVEGAIEEGGVVYWSTIIQEETHEELAEAFRDRYGLPNDFEVEYSLLSTSDLVTRVDQELTANQLTPDVVSVASLPWLYGLIEQGELMEYESPSYENYGPAKEAGLTEEGYWVADGYTFLPMWNPEVIDVTIESWQDLNDPRFRGEVVAGDADQSESYALTHLGLQQVLPQSYFEGIAGLDPIFLVRSEDIAQRVAAEDYPIAYSGMPTRAYQWSERGVELEVAYPEEGIVLLPQPFVIMQDSTHPNAAMLWIDFIFSEQGQTIYQENEALMSGLEGFEGPSAKYAPPISSVNAIPIDWRNVTESEIEEARGNWSSTF
jgi:iron(III) transport system substrate-binding protein